MKRGFDMKKYLLGFGVLGCFLMGMGVHCLTPLPIRDSVTAGYPERFIISTANSFETQLHNECSAFSTAYVLRHFGESQEGLALYEQFQYKLPFSGYVLPKGILTYFDNQPYDVKLFTGTWETLKTQVAKGDPVIVLVGDGLNWQHYMTVVGYDDTLNEVYFFDSLREGDENESEPGNRTLTTDYFLSMWDNGLPLFNQIYFTIHSTSRS